MKQFWINILISHHCKRNSDLQEPSDQVCALCNQPRAVRRFRGAPGCTLWGDCSFSTSARLRPTSVPRAKNGKVSTLCTNFFVFVFAPPPRHLVLYARWILCVKNGHLKLYVHVKNLDARNLVFSLKLQCFCLYIQLCFSVLLQSYFQ